MDILVDASGFRDIRNGVAVRTLRLMERVVPALADGHRFQFLVHPDVQSVLQDTFTGAEITPWPHGVESALRRIRGHNRKVRRLCRDRGVGLICQELRPFSLPENSLVTIHDTRFLRRDLGVSLIKRWGLRWTLPGQLRRARGVLVPTHAVRDELVSRFSLDEDSVNVISNGVDQKAFAASANHGSRRALLGIADRPYFLFVGHREKRKNIPLILRLLVLLKERGCPHRLIVAGRVVPGFEEPERLTHQLGLQKDVLFLDSVGTDDLPALYRGASVFLFPSLHEGFGLPLLEAMASDCPVVCTKLKVHEEVAPGSAVGDEHDESTWVEPVLRLLTDDTWREQVVAEGKRHVETMGWAKSAQQLGELIEQLASQDHA